jgi:hypothetical protein
MRHLAWIAVATVCTSAVLAAGLADGRTQAGSRAPAHAPGTIVLPEKIVAGAPATLAVLDAGGRLVPGAAVELSPGAEVTTDATGRAAFSAPGLPGVLSARQKDNEAVFTVPVISLPKESSDTESAGAGTPAPASLVFPRIVALGARCVLQGSGFRGDASGDRVLFGDEPALVLAASPVSLVVLPNPRTSLGVVSLAVQAGSRPLGSKPVTVVSLSVTGPAKPLAAGEMGTLTVRVSGSTERLVVEVRNLSPEVIKIPRGDPARVATSGGEPNAATVLVAGVKPGDYAVSARIVPGAIGLPDVEGARRELLAARQFAGGRWRKRLDRIIHRLEHNPQDIARIRDEIAELMAEHPPGEVEERLRVAWNVLEAG